MSEVISTHTFIGGKNKFQITLDYVGISIEIEDNIVNVYHTDGRLNIFNKRTLIAAIPNKGTGLPEEKNAKAKLPVKK